MSEQQEKLYFKSVEILQNENRKVFLYICSLFIALSSGALALSINLLANENFEKIITYIWLYRAAVIFLALSFVMGIIAVLFYLCNIILEIDMLTEIKKEGEEHPEISDEMVTKRQKRHKVSGYIFVSQIPFFCAGGIFLLSAIFL